MMALVLTAPVVATGPLAELARAVPPGLGGASPTASGAGALGLALALGAFTLLPAVVLCCTHFVRFVVVLGFVRTGLGTPSAPPTQVITGLALLLTAFSAAPLASSMYHGALEPYLAGQLTAEAALDQATPELQRYLVARTEDRSLELFYDASGLAPPPSTEQVPLSLVVPAFVLSELSTAFTLGLTILLPFLVIDLLAAIVLTALGMVMVPPYVVALPLKLLVFTLIDGWHLVVGALLSGVLGGGG